MAMAKAKLQSAFATLLAPRLLATLRADAKGVTPLGARQRGAMREMLRKFMPAAELKEALASIKPKRKSSRQSMPKRTKRIRRR